MSSFPLSDAATISATAARSKHALTVYLVAEQTCADAGAQPDEKAICPGVRFTFVDAQEMDLGAGRDRPTAKCSSVHSAAKGSFPWPRSDDGLSGRTEEMKQLRLVLQAPWVGSYQ
jgi:hypothetical protein